MLSLSLSSALFFSFSLFFLVGVFLNCYAGRTNISWLYPFDGRIGVNWLKFFLSFPCNFFCCFNFICFSSYFPTFSKLPNGDFRGLRNRCETRKEWIDSSECMIMRLLFVWWGFAGAPPVSMFVLSIRPLSWFLIFWLGNVDKLCCQ